MGILWRTAWGAAKWIRRLDLRLSNWLWSRLTWRSQVLEQRLIEDQQRENDNLRSDKETMGRQISQLAEIIARDRERIAAETAIQSRRKAEAESGPRVGVASEWNDQ